MLGLTFFDENMISEDKKICCFPEYRVEWYAATTLKNSTVGGRRVAGLVEVCFLFPHSLYLFLYDLPLLT